MVSAAFERKIRSLAIGKLRKPVYADAGSRSWNVISLSGPGRGLKADLLARYHGCRPRICAYGDLRSGLSYPEWHVLASTKVCCDCDVTDDSSVLLFSLYGISYSNT